ncbi:hypothetical protein, partial [Aeromonas jandaei]|uniref:hypothetical protein n=1 Tax=Aeromonas jandaei TaxID=650 RepID=UPI002AA0D767
VDLRAMQQLTSFSTKRGNQLHKQKINFTVFHDIAQFQTECWLTHQRVLVNLQAEFSLTTEQLGN